MESTPQQNSTDGPDDYFRPFWRFKWIILLVVAAVGAAVYGFYDAKSRIYSATSVIYVGPSASDTVLGAFATSASTTRTLANQARLVSSPDVARRVSDGLPGNPSPRALLGAITVAPDKESDFISISAEVGDARLAAAIANGFANAYIKIQSETRTSALKGALAEAQSQLTDIRGNGPDALGQRGVIATRISDLQAQLAATEPTGEVSSSASVPGTAESPRPLRNTIFGAALALILATIGAFLFDRADRRVRTVDDFEAVYGAPVLATVPKVRRPAPVVDGKAEVPSDLREAHRTLRANIDLASLDRSIHSLLVTSAITEEGKSTIVRNLALAYRAAGLRVIVVEADLRRPTLTRILGVESGPGLAEVLMGAIAIDDAFLEVHQDELDVALNLNGASHNGQVPLPAVDPVRVLSAGQTIVDPTTLLTADRFEPLLARLQMTADIVLIDAPPLLAVGDALPLLSLVDGLVLVGRVGITTSDAARRLRRTLDRVPGVRLLGTVVNAAQDSIAYEYTIQRPSAAATPIAR